MRYSRPCLFRTYPKRRKPLHTSHMSRVLFDRERSFLHRLCQCWVDVEGTGDVFGGGAELRCGVAFYSQVSRFRPDDAGTEHSLSCGVGQYFHEAVSGAVDLGAALAVKGNLLTEATAGNGKV